MATSSKQQHWLIGVAGRAELGGLRDIRLPLDTPPAQAWEKAATELEISQEELARHVAEAFRMKVDEPELAQKQDPGSERTMYRPALGALGTVAAPLVRPTARRSRRRAIQRLPCHRGWSHAGPGHQGALPGPGRWP